MHAAMITRVVPSTLVMTCVLVIASCSAPLPRLDRYSGDASWNMPDSRRNIPWKIADDGDLQDTLHLLLQDTDPDVRQHARNVETMLDALAMERRIRLEEILDEETDELDRITHWASSGDEGDRLPDGMDPMKTRSRLIDDALGAEQSGEFGSAARSATMAMALEWIIDDESMMKIPSLFPRRIASRNRDRLKNIRMVDPKIALEMLESESAPEWIDDVDSNEGGSVRSGTSIRERIMNTARAIGYFEDLHVDGVDRETIHDAGVEELRLITRTLIQKGHLIPDAFVRYIENDLPERTDQETIRLLVELDDAQMTLAEGTLPGSFSMRVFGDGAAGAMDKQTSVIWPREFKQYVKSSGRGYRGIGVRIEEDVDGRIILRPHNGGPAKRAGVVDGDVLLEVEGIPIERIGAIGLADMVDEGGREEIELRVEHADDTSESVMVRLGPVTNLNVTGWRQIGLDEDGLPTWWWLADDRTRIGYLRLERFAAGGARDVRIALQIAQAQALSCGGRLEGLIIDLRANPGGQVTVAEEMINLFMGDGPVFRSIGRDDRMEIQHADPRHSELEGLPLVILVDESSASASELVAGLLKNRDRAIILGERTFGKGSVQGLLSGSSQDCLIRVTVAWYQLPVANGSPDEWRFVDRETSPGNWGVQPHIRISTSVEQTRKILDARSMWHSLRGADIPLDDGEGIERPDPATEMALALLGSRINDIREP